MADVTYVIGAGTDDAHEATITDMDVYRYNPMRVKDAKYRDFAITLATRQAIMWMRENDSAEHAETMFEDEHARAAYRSFEAHVAAQAYANALAGGRYETAFNEMTSMASTVMHAYQDGMLDFTEGACED